MLKQHASKIKYINVLTDMFSSGLAFYLAFYLRNLSRGEYYFEDYPHGIFIVLTLWGILSYYFHFGRAYRFTSIKTEIGIVFRVSTFGVILILLFQYLLKLSYFPRSFLIIFYFTGIIFLTFGRFAQRWIIGQLQKRGFNIKTILIVGDNELSRNFIRTLNKHSEWGLKPIGLVSGDSKYSEEKFENIEVFGVKNNFRSILHNNPVDLVCFAFSFLDDDIIKSAMDVCVEEGMHYILISDFFTQETGKIILDEIYNIPILYFSPTPNRLYTGKLLIKRIFDILVSCILLFIFSPLMFLIALVIKFTSKGPVLYEWNVVGLNKKPFKSWKFRTMVINADTIKDQLNHLNIMKGPVFKMKKDPRITGIGKQLRKYSLDELPQLFSVLKGDMSLVGPHPASPHELKRYENWQRRKLSIKPGITCLWQVQGRTEINDFNDWAKLDLEYIDNWSLWLDLKILLKTIPAVLKGTGY